MTGLPEWLLDEVRDHAQEYAPQEVGGAILERGGSYIVVRGRNVAPDPFRHFLIDPETWDDLVQMQEEGHRVAYLYHSHPMGPPWFSDTDKEACNAAQVPFLLWTGTSNRFLTLAPQPFWLSLLDHEWNWGVSDCCTLVEEFYHRWMGSRPPFVALRPADFDPDRPTVEQVTAFERAAASHGWVRHDFDPKTASFGDVLAMASRPGSPLTVHVGVLVGDQVLHHQMGARSRLDDFNQDLFSHVRSVWRRGAA